MCKQKDVHAGVCVAQEKQLNPRGRGNADSKRCPLGFDISILPKLITDSCSSYDVSSQRHSKAIQGFFLALNIQSLFRLYFSLGFVELALGLISENYAT